MSKISAQGALETIAIDACHPQLEITRTKEGTHHLSKLGHDIDHLNKLRPKQAWEFIHARYRERLKELPIEETVETRNGPVVMRVEYEPSLREDTYVLKGSYASE